MGFRDGTLQHKSDNPPKVWERDLKVEARGKTNFMYRTGFLFGVLLTWLVVGTGYASFLTLAGVTGVVLFVTTVWDLWKVWRGK